MTRVTDIIERTKRREEEERRRGEAELIHHRAFPTLIDGPSRQTLPTWFFGLKRTKVSAWAGSRSMPTKRPNSNGSTRRVLLLPSGTSVKAADNAAACGVDLLLQARL